MKNEEKLTQGEIKILEACYKKPRKFTYLQKNVVKGFGVLSRYLKRLQKDKLLEREVDTREYRTTKKGEEALLEKKLLQPSEDAGHVLYHHEINVFEGLKQILDKKYVKGVSDKALLDDLAPLKKAPVDLMFFIDKRHLKSIRGRDFAFTCGDLAEQFVQRVKAILTSVYGFQSWQGWEKEPLQFQKAVEQERKTLDFEATLVLHFNGKKITQEIDWDSLLKRYEELDERARESWQLFVDTVAKDPSVRHNWLVGETIEKARKVESVGAQKFLAEAFPQKLQKIAEDMWAVFGSPEKAKEALLAEVCVSAFGVVMEGLTGKRLSEAFATELTEEQKQRLEEAKTQARKVIDELVEEGVIEFVPVYLPRLNREKANVKQWQVKEGYPSPTAYLAEEPEPEVEVEEAEEDSQK